MPRVVSEANEVSPKPRNVTVASSQPIRLQEATVNGRAPGDRRMQQSVAGEDALMNIAPLRYVT